MSALLDADEAAMSAIVLMMQAHEDQYRKSIKPGEFSAPTQLIIADVLAHRTEENAKLVDALIENAKKEMYNDFLSEFAFPAMELRSAMSRAGMPESLLANVENGKYDA